MHATCLFHAFPPEFYISDFVLRRAQFIRLSTLDIYIYYAMELMNYSYSTSLNKSYPIFFFKSFDGPNEIYAFDISMSRFLRRAISAYRALHTCSNGYTYWTGADQSQVCQTGFSVHAQYQNMLKSVSCF